MNPTGVVAFVNDPPPRPFRNGTAPREAAVPSPGALAPSGPTVAPHRWPEPPVLRSDPLTAPRACVNCASPVGSSLSTPRCWGCGRALCTDCYWRHGLVPSAHLCTSCLVTSPHGPETLSGGYATAPRTGFTPAAAPPRSG